MQLTQDLYRWLKSQNIIVQATPKQNGKFELDAETTAAFYNGFKINELLDKLQGPYTQQIKMQTNPTARLYNWNILTERLHQVKIDLDSDIKQLIIGGDLEMIVEVLKDLQGKFHKETSEQISAPKKPVDLENLNSAKPLSSSESIMEFIVVALCQAMQLKPRQAQQLLNNNFKLLTHVFIKGVKGQYQPLMQLFFEMYNNAPRLVELCKDEEYQITYLISFIKLSLFSKDEEVVHWGLRLIGKLGYELAQLDLLFHLFQWCINGGMQSLIITQQRQPQLAEALAVSLTQIASYDYKQIYGTSKYFDNSKSLIDFYGPLLPYIKCDLLTHSLDTWIQQAIQQGESQCTRDEKNSSLQFLCNCWIQYHQYFEMNLQYQQQVLAIIQRSAKDNSQILKVYSITLAFKLIDSLAQRKAISATLVYKKILSMLIESQNSEFIVKQCIFLIQRYPNVPVELLVEALVKHQHVNVSDCEIYQVISAHQNLRIPSATLLLELLVRLYNTNIIFQSCILIAIQQIIQKFIEMAEFQDVLVRISQQSLTQYIGSIKLKKSPSVVGNIYDDSVVNQQRRAQIIELLKFILQQKCYSMNTSLKPLLVQAFLELRNIENRDNKGIVVLLQMLGDPTAIIEEVVKDDHINDNSQLFLEKKINQMGGGQSNILQDQFMSSNKDMFQREEDLVKSLLIEDQQLISKANQQSLKKKKKNYNFDDFQCIYEEGELAYKPLELDLIEFINEEDVDRESINIAIKQYNKTFRYLYNKYAISPQEAAKNRLRNLDQNNFILRASDIMRMLQDYEVQNFSTFEEIVNLITLINTKYNYFAIADSTVIKTEYNSVASNTSAKHVNHNLDYECFKRFLVQLAVVIFSRPPKDLRKLPAGHLLVEFFRFFSYVSRRKNENSLIFDDPDGVTTVADKQTIQKWNTQLLQHPNTEVPAETSLKKVQIEEVSLSYSMRRVMPQLPESYMISYEIVNDIMMKKFKSNIIEPTFEVNLIYQVKPIAAKGVHKDAKVDPLLEKQENLKNSISLLPHDKAEILNRSMDISQLVDETRIINKSILSRMVNESELLLQKELREIKFKSRKQYLDKQYQKIQQHRDQKEVERVAIQAMAAESKLKEIQDFKPKHSQFMEKKREELNKFSSQVFQPIEDPFKTRKVSATAETLKAKTQIIKQSEDVHKERELEKNAPKLDKEKHKKVIEKAKKQADHYEKVKEMKVEFTQKFSNFYKDAGVQAQFKHFRKTGSMAFNHFLKLSDPFNYGAKCIQLEGWLEFCETFSLTQLFTQPELVKTFTQTLKAKNVIQHMEAAAEGRQYVAETGLTYFEFEYMLLRMAILGEEYFNKIKSGKDPKQNYAEMLTYKANLLKKPKPKFKQQELLMKHMSNTNSVTLEGMLGYLDVPSDQALFAGKLRSLVGSDVKKVTIPKQQSVDIIKLKQDKGLPEEPDVRPHKDWKQPGYHASPDKIKLMEEKASKTPKFPFIGKNHKKAELLSKFGQKQ